MPDSTLSQAIKEAYATGVAEPILFTLELRHPDFTEPIRVVRDKADLVATLEADAPADPGGQVTFHKCAFDLVLPEVSETSAPDLTLSIDNVSAELVPYLDLAAQSESPIQVTMRTYLPSDTSKPQNNPPITMLLKDARPTPLQVAATVGWEDPSAMRYPADVYDAERFPGLTT